MRERANEALNAARQKIEAAKKERDEFARKNADLAECKDSLEKKLESGADARRVLEAAEMKLQEELALKDIEGLALHVENCALAYAFVTYQQRAQVSPILPKEYARECVDLYTKMASTLQTCAFDAGKRVYDFSAKANGTKGALGNGEGGGTLQVPLDDLGFTLSLHGVQTITCDKKAYIGKISHAETTLLFMPQSQENVATSKEDFAQKLRPALQLYTPLLVQAFVCGYLTSHIENGGRYNPQDFLTETFRELLTSVGLHTSHREDYRLYSFFAQAKSPYLTKIATRLGIAEGAHNSPEPRRMGRQV
ncbi:hypothetical protein HZB01_00740 [Candidatus Woesearchaeota archaeon]|nr:hypothetical protein [Candidatus Woesearchaeota archaeon]